MCLHLSTLSIPPVNALNVANPSSLTISRDIGHGDAKIQRT